MRNSCRGGRYRFCHESDHEAANCPVPKRCLLCGAEDHLYKACPARPWTYTTAVGGQENDGQRNGERSGERNREEEVDSGDGRPLSLAEVSVNQTPAMRQEEAKGEASGVDSALGVPLVVPEAAEPDAPASLAAGAGAGQGPEGRESQEEGGSQQSLLLSPRMEDLFLVSGWRRGSRC